MKKKIKISILFWFLTCLIGSIIVIEMERYLLNIKGVFNISYSEGVFFSSILTTLTLIVSFPFMFLSYFYIKKGFNQKKVIYTIGFLFYIAVLFTTFYLSNSIFEALYFTIPYIILSLIFGFIYQKLYSNK